MNKTLIVTTIAAPNECLTNLSKGAKSNGYNFICVGDKKSPEDFQLDGCQYYGPQEQIDTHYSLAQVLPWNHYGRKNVGYLIAMQQGAEQILETDDDNFPENDDFWKSDDSTRISSELAGSGWFNVYEYFGVDAWPRGFPLEQIRNSNCESREEKFRAKPLIVQSLVNGDPDVDAVFRLTRDLNIKFNHLQPVALGKDLWCPFNSQNTFWQKAAFPLLYLPVTCSFRATDIIRSYVAQRCIWEQHGRLVFCTANARQVRNEHNLLKDFDDEIVIYLNAEKIRLSLSKLKLKQGDHLDCVIDNLFNCYRELVSLNVVSEKELEFIEAWTEDSTKILSV